MSIGVQSIVWEHSSQRGTALLLLIALADFAHDDGTGAWPSIETLAHKTRQSGRNVERTLRVLEKSHEVSTLIGEGPHGANAYKINIKVLLKRRPYLSGVTNRVSGVTSRARGVTNRAKKKPQLSPNPSLTITEPSKEPLQDTDAAKKAAAPEPLPVESPKKIDYFPTAQALSEVTGLDIKIKCNSGRLFARGKELCAATIPATPELIRQYYGAGAWWYQSDWRGQKGQKPKPEEVCETWGKWMQPQVIPRQKDQFTKLDAIRMVLGGDDGIRKLDPTGFGKYFADLPLEAGGEGDPEPDGRYLEGRVKRCT